jgi:hypothetical protein
MGKLTFYKTIPEGQHEVAVISLEDGVFMQSGEMVEGIERILLSDVDRDDTAAVLKAMKDAPRRFDGAYLRATYEES